MPTYYPRTTATEAGTDGVLTVDLGTTAGATTLASQNVNDTAFTDCQVWTRTIGAGVLASASSSWAAQLSIASISGTIEGRFRLERVNSSGVSQAQSAWSATFTTTGTKTLSTTWAAGTWSAGDRLVVRLQILRAGGHGNVSLTTDITSASNVTAPAAPVNVTVTPAVVAATGAVPGPTAKGQAKPTPAAVAATTTAPTPTPLVAAPATVTPAATAAVVAVPGPTAGYNPLGVAWHTAFWADDPNWANPGDGNAVSQWDDGSGSGNHLTQSTGTNQPLFRSSTTALNNRATVEFLSSDYMQTSAFAAAITGQSSYFIVAQLTALNGSANDQIINGISGTDRRSILTDFASGDWGIFAGTDNCLGGTRDTDPHYFFAEYDYSGSTGRLEIDGAAVTLSPTTAGTENLTGITLAATAGGTARTTMHVAFVGVYDGALSAGDLADLEAWAADYYFGAAGATVTPAAVDAPAAVPTPAPLAAATVTPNVADTAATVPGPTARGQATATPAAADATTTAPGPTARGQATATPAAADTVATTPTPAPLAAATVTPNVADTAATAPTPTPKGGVASQPATADTTVTAPTPNLAAAAVVAPAAADTAATVPNPTAGAGATATPAVIAALSDVLTPTASAGAQVTPAVVVATTGTPTPTIEAAAVVAAALVAALSDVPTPSIVAGGAGVATPSTVAAIAQALTPALAAAATATPATAATTATVPTPAVGVATTATPNVVAAIVAAPTPTASGGAAATATPATIDVVAAIPGPTAAAGALVAPAVIAALVAIPTPTAYAGELVLPRRVEGAATVFAVVDAAGATVGRVAVTGTTVRRID